MKYARIGFGKSGHERLLPVQCTIDLAGCKDARHSKLGLHEAAATLRETLEEEGRTDRDLTHLVERVVNFKAMIA